MNDKFEFADAAAAELDIALDQIGRTQLLFDLALHRAQLTQGVEIEITAIDEAREFVEQAVAGSNRAGDGPRTQQHRSLPRVAHTLVIAERALDRDHEWGTTSTGPQTHIDAETFGSNDLGQRLTDAIGDLEAPRIDITAEQINQVDVGTEIELLCAELAHREHAEIVAHLGVSSGEM